MEIKLNESDIDFLENLKKDYRKLEDDFKKIEREIESLNKSKSRLLINLKEVRGKELNFYNKLQEKYGEGTLNIKTKTFKVENG